MRAPTSPPRLGFFTELDELELVALFTPAVVEKLLALRASVTMGLRDLGNERARVVRRLNDAGVPVIAWLLLPRAHGYFATADNAQAVERRWADTRAWLEGHQLRVERVGLDFERDVRDLERFFVAPKRTVLRWLASAGHASRVLASSHAHYAALVRRIRDEGFRTESYLAPFVLDDRRAGGVAWQALSGALDVKTDVDVVMLYTSLLGPLGPALVESYAPECEVVGVGSTGGGIDPWPKLSWPHLERDLRLAARACEEVRIFSLEGCVQQNFLGRLVDFDWSGPAPVSSVRRLGARAWRTTASLVSGRVVAESPAVSPER